MGYGNDPSYVSHAHGWSSGPTSTLTNYLVGLQVTRPAGAEWALKPAFWCDIRGAGGLHNIKGEVQRQVYGQRWNRNRRVEHASGNEGLG